VANGYVVTVGGKRLYFAGVTECVPEIRALQRIDVAFVPMNLPQGRMTPPAVAECLRSLRPSVAYPYHYDQGYIGRLSGRAGQAQPAAVTPADTVRTLANAVKGDGIDVRAGDWYPLPPGF
jgi:L-ascorbate metabolism protein UlaG (beta-lactamase superfamily)